MSEESSRIIACHDYGPKRFKWITLKLIEWQDPSGKTRFWESCERTTRAASGVDAVAIVVKAISTSSPPQVIIVSQYRPPLASICLELPAGLIDKGESAEDAAFRELYEETGLTPHRLISVSPVCCSDPGMTNTNMQLAVVEVDLDAPINRNTKQNLDDGECIDIEMAPWEGLLPWLIQRKRELGCQIDARLMSFALGLDLGTKSTASTSSPDGTDNGIAAVARTNSQSRKSQPDTNTKSSTTTDTTSNITGASIAPLTEKNIAIKNSPTPSPSSFPDSQTSIQINNNKKVTQHHAGNVRSDSAQTDVLQAMSSLQIQAAAKAYAATLEEFHAGQHQHNFDKSGDSLVSTTGQGASRMALDTAGGAPQVAVGVAGMAAKGVSATRASSSVISDGEGGES